MKHYWFSKSDQHLLNHECSESGCVEQSEADVIAMQTIDADCNDCRHFKRGELIKEIDGVTKPKVKLNRESYFFRGTCMKFNRPTTAHPTQFTGWECFEHRRA